MLKLAVGEQVWMFDPSTKKGENKMKIRWKGPYTIVEKVSSTVYILDVNGHPYSANIERLKKAVTDNDNNNNSDEKKKDSDTLQLEKLNEELDSMRQMQQTLIHKQKLTELQKEQLSEKIKVASAAANQIAAADAEQEEEKYDGEDEVSELSAAIVMHLHSGEVNWIT
jgi:TolA-binding protein